MVCEPLTPDPQNAGPGCTPNRSASTLIVRIRNRAVWIRRASILIAAIAAAVLIGAVALRRFAIAIAHVLLVAILIAARGPLCPLLIVVAFLIRHVSLPPRPRQGGRVVTG